MEQKFVVGVDISKHKVDCAVVDSGMELHQEQIVVNTESELVAYFRGLLKSLKLDAAELLVCCETTGIYNEPLRGTCIKLGIGLWEEQPLKIKRASTDLRGKSDRLDARRIASYALRFADRQQRYHAPDASVKKLAALSKSRDTLVTQRVMIHNQIKEAKTHDQILYNLLRGSYKSTLCALDRAIGQIEQHIDTLIDRDAELKKNKQLLVSVTSIGSQTANNLIIATHNFKHFTSAKQLACYAGVVPFDNQSGILTKRPRVSSLANKKLKTLLHMAALNAIRFDRELKAYYGRKVQEGKNKMAVINAVRNKLVHRIMAVINRQSPYVNCLEGCYQPTKQIT